MKTSSYVPVVHDSVSYSCDALIQVAALNRRYLWQYLTEAQRVDGFLRFELNYQELERMVDYGGVFTALTVECDKRVVGYMLWATLGLAEKMKFYQTALGQAMKMCYQGKPLGAYRCMLLVQICIDEDHRGGEVLELLHAETRRRLTGQGIELAFGEIDKLNTRSYAANVRKMGMIPVGEYRDGEVDWTVVAADYREPKKEED